MGDAALEPYQKLPQPLMLAFMASARPIGSSTLVKIRVRCHSNIEGKPELGRRWRGARAMEVEANAAYSEGRVKLADNGSLGPAS